MSMPDYKYVKYDQVEQVFLKNGRFRADCSTIIFFNQGTQFVYVDKLKLLPGQGYTLEGYPGEMNMHTYEIVFDNPGNAGCSLWIGMKVYVSHQDVEYKAKLFSEKFGIKNE